MIDPEDLAKAAPLPWNTLEVGSSGNGNGGYHLYITDANGRKIAAVWGKPVEKAYTASLIVSAVNALLPQEERQDATVEAIAEALLAAGVAS